MAALIFLVAMGCIGSRPAFPCCHHEEGRSVYGEVWDEPATSDQVEVVRAATVRGVIDGSVDEQRVARSIAQHARARAFWSTLAERAERYEEVLGVVRGAAGSEVLVAGAYVASGLRTRHMAGDCRDGLWQLPLVTEGVGPCQLTDDSWWTPADGKLPIDGGGHCMVRACRPDPRREVLASTKLALAKVPAGASDQTSLVAMDLGDPAVATAVHILAICALPDLFPSVDRAHCEDIAGPPGRH